MILLLNTSTPVCEVSLVNSNGDDRYSWQADRTLARDLLGYLRDRLAEHNVSFGDVCGIGVMKGPGSFTGLRIGVTVANTLARELDIPIVGVEGEKWSAIALERLENSETDAMVVPEYGRSARVTTPKK